MRLIIHDLPPELFHRQHPSLPDTEVIENTAPILRCTGCFKCWVKTPLRCVLRDGYETAAERVFQSDELIIISRCTYGGYSHFVKNVIDRSIGSVLPGFTIRNNEIHHLLRRDMSNTTLKVWFYGCDITAPERETAEGMVRANGLNFGRETSVTFITDAAEVAL